MPIQRVSDKQEFGSIVNDKGDIFVRNPTPDNPDGVGILTKGTVLVTLEQARIAKDYGWKTLTFTQRDGMIEVTRGVLN